MKRREELKEKKKKKIDTDVLVVLGVLGSIILLAVIMAFFQSQDAGKTMSGTLSGSGSAKENSATLKVVLTCTFFAAFFVCLFVIKMIRDKNRKKRQVELEKLEKQQRLEEARERVRRAKMDELLMSGNSVLEKRRREEELLRRTARRPGTERTGYDARREYRRRDLNEFKEEPIELDYEEDLNWFQRLMLKIKGIFGHKEDEED